MPKKIKLSFEEKLSRLDDIVDILDEAEAPIDELLKIFEEGMKLSSELKDYLHKVELKVFDITKTNSNFDEEFDEE